MKNLFARAALVAFLAVAGGAAAAEVPPAALPSARAAQSLLLDVTRAGQRLVAVGERGHIVFSDDTGRTWRQATVPVRTLLTAVAFPVPEAGWAVGHDGVILHSGDRGETWTIQRRQPFDEEASLAAEEEALAEAEAAGVDVESDAGAAIGLAAASRVGAALLDVWFADAQRGIAIGANGTLLETEDGGATWNDRSTRIDNPDGWHLNAIAAQPGNPQVLVVAGEKGMLFRSADGGRTFRRVQAGSGEGSWFGVLGSGKEFYLFGLQGRLFRSADGGASWRAVDSGVTSGLNDGVALPGGSVVIAGNAGVVVTVAAGAARASTVRRADRQSVTAAVAVDGSLVLVGEGGARLARVDGSEP